jgi:hypothetical protein
MPAYGLPTPGPTMMSPQWQGSTQSWNKANAIDFTKYRQRIREKENGQIKTK